LLNGSTFTNWTTKVQQQANTLGISLAVAVHNVTISQQTPWKINVSIVASIDAQDQRGTVFWKREKEVSSLLDIRGFEDCS